MIHWKNNKWVRKNILTVLPYFWWGGMTYVSININNELSKYYNTYYLNFTYSNFDRENEIKNTKYYNFNEKKLNFLEKIIYLLVRSYKIAKICKINNISIIISHWEEANFSTILVKFFIKNIKILPITHWIFYEYKNRIWNILYFLIYRLNVIYCVSENVKKLSSKYYKIKNNNFKVIYNWVDYEKLYTKKINQISNILYLWRIEKEKWIYDLIEAFKEIKNNNITLNIVWFWNKEEEEKLKHIIKNDKRINFFWKKTWVEKENIIKKNELFVFPTCYSEGFGLTTYENAVYWLSIITTNHADIIKHFGNNIYICEKNNILSIKENIIKLLDKKNIYNDYRNILIKLSKEKILKQWINEIEK